MFELTDAVGAPHVPLELTRMEMRAAGVAIERLSEDLPFCRD